MVCVLMGLWGSCRMTESSYDLMFSKLARARLFNMYFDESRNILAHIVLQPADDPNVDVTARVIPRDNSIFSFRARG